MFRLVESDANEQCRQYTREESAAAERPPDDGSPRSNHVLVGSRVRLVRPSDPREIRDRSDLKPTRHQTTFLDRSRHTIRRCACTTGSAAERSKDPRMDWRQIPLMIIGPGRGEAFVGADTSWWPAHDLQNPPLPAHARMITCGNSTCELFRTVRQRPRPVLISSLPQ